MQSFSKLLLPVDFSERSAGAAHCARALAARFDSEVVLLHVLPPPQYDFGAMDAGGTMLAELYRSRSEQSSQDLQAFAQAELEGLNARRVILEGDPAATIVRFAHEENVGLIVMPTHGFGPFRRFILGSNTAKVLHDADCPVWTGVHLAVGRPDRCLPPREIVCAVDLGPQSSKTLCWAAVLAREFDAHLTVLHTVAASIEPGDAGQKHWLGDVWRSAEAELQRLLEFVKTEATVLIEHGDPAGVICAATERLGAGVLVIGRGSAAGVFGRLRTNAYSIIRQSPCPVVSV
jgi:nucleotide-binding universal stress UspA family protein